MLALQEHIPLRSKTTMRIGGHARYYAELGTKGECEGAYSFAREKKLPLIVLGGGSNTIFADGIIDALVVRVKGEKVEVEGNRIRVEAGKNLPNFINELAEKNLDLSPLTGIPGTVGGAIFGNAGQGFSGIWMSHYVKEVEVFLGGEWQTLTQEGLHFAYRFSALKEMGSPIIWSTLLEVPSRPAREVKAEVERLLQRRIDTQPHVKTAGSCFLSLSKELPAWKLIDAAGFRGKGRGEVEVAEKHANFLLNKGNARFEDVKALVADIRRSIPEELEVEMRFIEEDGTLAF
jgi:UDP-N-acetylmuramate dehydrogenase